MEIPSYVFTTMATPVGLLKLVANRHGLAAILWENDDPARVPLGRLTESSTNPILQQTQDELATYFSGNLKSFTVPLHFNGTPFQQQVWNALLTIPYGETRTYTEIARQVGSPDAVRAVGAANGKNPISIIAPCHRVIGASGKLTGFAGGLAAKTWLLEHEGYPSAPTLF